MEDLACGISARPTHSGLFASRATNLESPAAAIVGHCRSIVPCSLLGRGIGVVVVVD